jgi:hypothetical protein
MIHETTIVSENTSRAALIGYATHDHLSMAPHDGQGRTHLQDINPDHRHRSSHVVGRPHSGHFVLNILPLPNPCRPRGYYTIRRDRLPPDVPLGHDHHATLNASHSSTPRPR